MARYNPAVVKAARGALAAMRRQMPGAIEMVYDNYNALVIGFSTTERPSDAVFSLGLYPRWINLYFLQNALDLADPAKLLCGNGTRVRSIRLTSGREIDEPAVRALIAEAISLADPPLKKTGRRKLVVRAVSPNQRRRR
jgi:hypothetical protein